MEETSPNDTTFYLDDLDVGAEPSRWGFHNPKQSRLPRFLLWGCALLLFLGLLLGLFFEGLAFLKENYWAPLLWIGIALLVYYVKFRKRPYFRIADDELAFCPKPHRAERRVPWDELEAVTLSPGAVILHRNTGGPVYLYFPNLSDERIQALQSALTDAARHHEVPTSSEDATSN